MPVKPFAPSNEAICGRILLYDANASFASELSEKLRDRGYVCSIADSAALCMRELENGYFKHLFVGKVEDNLRLFDVINQAHLRRVMVSPYDLFEGEDKGALVKKVLGHIEKTIILANHTKNAK